MSSPGTPPPGCGLPLGPSSPLLGGILKSLVDQGLENTAWIEANCEPPETLYYALSSLDMDAVARITHVSPGDIAAAARAIGSAGAASIVFAMDNVAAGIRRDCAQALTNLALLTGNVGRPGTGIFPLRPGANEQGAWDVGCAPDRLPGNRPIRDNDARQAVEDAWQASLPGSRGMGVQAAWSAAAGGEIRAMLISGGSPNFTNGKLEGGLSSLENLDFLVYLDEFDSPVTALADVVLPLAGFSGRDGTWTNLERRIQRLNPLRPPASEDGPRTELSIIQELARRMGASGFGHASPSEVMDEIASVSPIYSGVSYQALAARSVTVFRTNMQIPQPTQLLYSTKEDRGIQWPCTAAVPSSQPVLYHDGFLGATADPITPEFRTPEMQPDPDYPAWLVPGRVLLDQDHPGEATRGKSNRIKRDEWVVLNPNDAAGISISDGDTVEVVTGDSRLTGIARLDLAVPPGVLSTTRLFGQLAVEIQASEEPDPMSSVPGLDIVPARLVKTSPNAG